MVEKIPASFIVKRLKGIQWNRMFNMMYIEPLVFLLVFAHALSGTIMRNQIIYQACTTVFGHNETFCAQLGTKNVSAEAKAVETEVQPYVANLFMMRTLLESIVPAVCGIFVGSWSDHYGRKPLLFISMIGFSCTYLIAAGICEAAKYYPVNPWYYILTAVPHSVLGGNCVFTVAAFCFVSDVTDLKMRPYRMIFFEAFFFVGLTTGSLLSSFVYDALGATITFLISGILMCGATVFILICVPESLHYKLKDETEENKTAEAVDGTDVMQMSPSDPIAIALDQNGENHNQAQKDVDAVKNAVNIANKIPDLEKADKIKEHEKPHLNTNTNKDKNDNNTSNDTEKKDENKSDEIKTAGLFSSVHLTDMFKCVMKPRPHYDRAIIWLITGTMFVAIFVIDGAMTVFYLFVREKFHWTIREFTFYETISHMVTMFGAILGVVIMRKVFRLSIVTLAAVAFFSDIVSSIARGIATESWHLYLSVGLGVFRSVGGPMCRTIVSNIVPTNELGKIFSIKNVMQSFAPFLAAPLYTFIYKESLSTNPGLFNIVSAGLYGIGFIFVAIVLHFKFKAKDHYVKMLK